MGLQIQKILLKPITNVAKLVVFFLSCSVLFDWSRKELWLSNHITPYQCPSLVKLRRTLARRNSELAFLRGKNIHLLVTTAHTQGCKLLVFFVSPQLNKCPLSSLIKTALIVYADTHNKKKINDLQSLSRVMNWSALCALFIYCGLQRWHSDDSQRTAPCLLISSACFFLTSDFLFSLMWQHGSFNQLAHLELSL